MRETNIRFEGYHESQYGCVIEQMVADLIDPCTLAYNIGYAESFSNTEETDAERFLLAAGVDIETEQKRILATIDYEASRELLNVVYVNQFISTLNHATGLNIGLTYKSMQTLSSTIKLIDKITCDISLKDVEILHAFALDNLGAFKEVLKRELAHCKFCKPLYSDNVKDWIAKPLTDYDNTEVQMLLDVAIHSVFWVDEDDDFGNEVYDKVLHYAIYDNNLDLVINN